MRLAVPACGKHGILRVLLAAFTDARHFARLGIQSFGLTPMQLPSEMRFTELIRAADQRIPVDAER